MPPGYCVCLFLSPWCTEATILSTNQQMGMCSSTFSAPFQTAWYPNGGVLKTVEYWKQEWLSTLNLGPCPTFGNWNGSISRLSCTKPSCSAPWKRGMGERKAVSQLKKRRSEMLVIVVLPVFYSLHTNDNSNIKSSTLFIKKNIQNTLHTHTHTHTSGEVKG